VTASGQPEALDATPVVPRMVGLLRPHRRRVWQLLATTLFGAAFGVAAPLLTVAVFDKALFPADGDPRLGLLAFLVGLMVVLIGLAGVAGILQTYLSSNIGQLVIHDLRERLYRHLQRMPLRFFTSTRAGEIQSRLVNDVGGVGTVVSRSASSAVTNSVFLVTAFAAMFFLAWELALVVLALLPVFAYISHRLGRVRRRLSRETQETLAEMSHVAEETLSVSGALLAKVFGRQRQSVERYSAYSRRVASLRVRQEMVGRVFVGLAQTFFLLAPALAYLGAGLAMAGGSTRFTPGTLVAVTALQIRLFPPLRDLLTAYLEMQSARPMLERVFQYLELPHEITDSPDARTLAPSRSKGLVAFRDVSFRYPGPLQGEASRQPDRDWTLADLSLRVEPGQLAALVGPSGAGKTTTTYLLARLYDVDRGSVTIDGLDVRDIRLSSLADLIGMVTQETYLFNASIRDNLLYARPEAEPEEVEAAARLAFIHDRILQLEDGYETIVGERGYRFSGGEKQRLAIARVILKDPRILVLDEATSAMDTASERLVQGALEPLMADRTTIAIAHRLSTILAADVIFVLDRGRLIEQGTHEELLELDGAYARLYQQQFRGGRVEARCEDGVVLRDGEVVPATARLSSGT
jgi:ATP-binding cassette, subfamily B, bacterial